MGEPSRQRSAGALISQQWYGLGRWKRRRRDQLRREPFCCYCRDRRGIVTLATVADHVIPHRGDARAFWSGKLQSLCKTCHDGEKQVEEMEAAPLTIDADGWPVRSPLEPKPSPYPRSATNATR